MLLEDDHYYCYDALILTLIKRMVIVICRLVFLKEQYCLDQQMLARILTQAHHADDLLSLVVVVLNMPEG